MNKICTVEYCYTAAICKGYCRKHYDRFHKYGDATKRTKYDPNEIEFEENYALLHLYDDNCYLIAKVKIDYPDIKKVIAYKWGMMGKGYPTNCEKGYLHRFLVDAKDDEDCDHKNHNPLDCRRKNLRVCSTQQNLRNMRIPSHNTSGAKGVSWNKQAGKWHSYIYIDNKPLNLGNFRSLIHAAEAYNTAAERYFGEFAKLNDIEQLRRAA